MQLCKRRDGCCLQDLNATTFVGDLLISCANGLPGYLLATAVSGMIGNPAGCVLRIDISSLAVAVDSPETAKYVLLGT